MHYATHALSPLSALTKTRAARVHRFGSGTLRPELQAQYGSPFLAETAIFWREETDLAAEATHTLFQTARAYTESFAVYGERVSFEWQQVESEDPALLRMESLEPKRGRPIAVEKLKALDRQGLLPREIARFTPRGVYDEANPHLSFLQGGGHGGSHLHLAHEFVRSVVEGRPPAISVSTAANWTAAGICAHEGALRGGEAIEIPSL